LSLVLTLEPYFVLQFVFPELHAGNRTDLVAMLANSTSTIAATFFAQPMYQQLTLKLTQDPSSPDKTFSKPNQTKVEHRQSIPK
jgi:hypothetical protein